MFSPHLKPPPNAPNSESCSLVIVYICLHILCYQKYPLHNPPSHLAPLACIPPYPPTQKTILLILTSPGTMARPLNFGWWGIPSVDWWSHLGKSWVLIYQGNIQRCDKDSPLCCQPNTGDWDNKSPCYIITWTQAFAHPGETLLTSQKKQMLTPPLPLLLTSTISCALHSATPLNIECWGHFPSTYHSWRWTSKTFPWHLPLFPLLHQQNIGVLYEAAERSIAP